MVNPVSSMPKIIFQIYPLLSSCVAYTLIQTAIISHLDPCSHLTPDCPASVPTPPSILRRAASVIL